MNEPSCLYCGRQDGPFTGAAHVFPEALIANRVALPPGIICDPCNSYFGTHLDSVLVAHPFISFAIQFLGTPGKKGRPRSSVGNIQRDGVRRELVIPSEPPVEVFHVDGSRTYIVRPLVAKWFRSRDFSRALHHVAVNLIAFDSGPESARRPELAAVRTYVRQPQREEWRAFLVTATSLARIRPVIEGRRLPREPGELVCLRIFNFDFYVDLLDQGGLIDWGKAHLPQPMYTVDRHFRDPIVPESPEARYQLRIEFPG